MKNEKGISLIILVLIIVLILILGAVGTIVLLKGNDNKEISDYEENEKTTIEDIENSETNDKNVSENELNTKVYTTYSEKLKKSDITEFITFGEEDTTLVNYACMVIELPPIMYPTKVTLTEKGNEVNSNKVIFTTQEQYNDNYYIVCYIVFPADKMLSDYKLSLSSSNSGDTFEKVLSSNLSRVPENMKDLYNINGTTYWYKGRTPTGGATTSENKEKYNATQTVSYMYNFYPLDGNGLNFSGDAFDIQWTQETQSDIKNNFKLNHSAGEYSSSGIRYPVYSVRLYYNSDTIEKVYGNNQPNAYDLIKKQITVKYNNVEL